MSLHDDDEEGLTKADYEALEEARPKIRADCLSDGKNAQRPCPFVSCKWHLWHEYRRSYTKRHGRPLVIIDGINARTGHSCALDVADQGGASEVLVSKIDGVTRQNVSLMEARCLSRIQKTMKLAATRFNIDMLRGSEESGADEDESAVAGYAHQRT